VLSELSALTARLRIARLGLPVVPEVSIIVAPATASGRRARKRSRRQNEVT
jgi:hypothetical protein